MVDMLPDNVDRLRLALTARRPRVAIIGDFCLDAYWSLDTDADETSVETGLPVRRVLSQHYSLGGAGNVAANLVALGVASVRAVGLHGGDPFGLVMVGLLSDLGVDLDGMIDLGPDWETLTYAKPYSGRVELDRLDFGTRSQPPPAAVDALLQRVIDAIAWAQVVVINQQVRGFLSDGTVISALNRIITEHPETIFVVDARDSAGHFDGAILKINASEAARLAPDLASREPAGLRFEELARRITAQTGRPVFITRGDHGILAADALGVHAAAGIEILDEMDPVGAGDTVTATIAAVLASGGNTQTAADIANLAASVTVRKVRATGSATIDELAAAATHPDFIYAPDLADNPTIARLVPNSEIELVGPLVAHPPFTHAIFDHDGTLSTLRQGWEDVMEPMMIRAILGASYGSLDGATFQRVRTSVVEFINRTTGVQTLVQMQGLVGLVRRWGFVPETEILDEHDYKAIYNEVLLDLVRQRRSKLASGQLVPEDFHVKGAVPMLRHLRERGITLHLASGTDVGDVQDDARALGYSDFFGERIHGAVGDVTIEAKRVVLERLVRDQGLDGARLVAFGDGPVEMRVSRRYGGVAVGVCSDERRRFGFNPLKRARLIRGGAMLLIPDFSDVSGLMGILEPAGSSNTAIAVAPGRP